MKWKRIGLRQVVMSIVGSSGLPRSMSKECAGCMLQVAGHTLMS